MNSRARLLLTIALPIILIIVVVGVFVLQQREPTTTTSSQGTTKSVSLTHMTLALDWTPNTNHTGIYVAMAKGWYRDQGIDLQLLPYSSNINPDTLVSTGKADVGVSSTESVVADYGVGQPVVSIAAIIQHNTSALVTRADSGLNSPRDLDGKTYGGFGAPYETAVVSQIIEHAGGKGVFKNVTLNVDPIQALKSKQVDFEWIYQGWEGIQAEREGLKLNTFYITQNGVADYYTPTIVAGPNEIKQKPDLLRKFMAATSQGYEFARTHAQESAQILIDQNKGAFPDTGLVFASQNYLSPRYADAGRKWGLQDAAAWHGYPEFILSTGAVLDASGKPIKSINPDALYTNQFLP
ncbi:MAG: ABC transporter substrate-binding protein [Chloroflexota bacterium]|nr:ABC transporter substrate-binding protein [Chloroflexota bacterium]